jgi:ABC-type multidrug transport system ATPase subunit
MAALLVDRKDKMSVCSIDEPEMNLHPEWQSRFSDWLLSSNASRQFFISSHSPEILDPLTPAFMNGDLKLFVFSDTEPIVELLPDKISELYGKGFNIGDLYRAKAIEIGGWPK